jgi:hypothetical protein
MTEPLEHLLEIYSDKNKVLLHYLPHETVSKLTGYEYVRDRKTLFLNDRLIMVSKASGKILIHSIGICIKLKKDRCTIKSRNANISFKLSDHYIFMNPRKNQLQKNNRDFYEELLKSLN